MTDIVSADPGLTEHLHRTMPLTEVLGLEALSATSEQVEVRGHWDGSRCTAADRLHGGYLMALADATAAWCAVLNLPAHVTASTIESTTNFVRAVRRGFVVAVATPVHVGTRTIVVQTDVKRDDGRLVTRTLATQALSVHPTLVG